MKIAFAANGCAPREAEGRNIAHARGLGLPQVDEKPRPALAVVGGGHSALEHLEELRHWPGDIWACGSAYQWCASKAVDATFFCVDPQPQTAALAKGAARAILCTSIDPTVFETLKDASVQVFDLVHEGERCNHGATSVTATPELALRMGYREITYFGCESSYRDGVSHAYHHEPTQYVIRVCCNGESFDTNPAYLMQAEYLATMIRLAPMLRERSGGLLRAMTHDLEYDITHGSQNLHDVVRNVA